MSALLAVRGRVVASTAVVIAPTSSTQYQKRRNSNDQNQSDGRYDTHDDAFAAAPDYAASSHRSGKNGNLGLSALAISGAIVGKSILNVRSARNIVAQIAIAGDVDRKTDHCGDQRKDDDNGVEHFFASCDVLANLLSQVARSPK
jgi:hypothetical protein